MWTGARWPLDLATAVCFTASETNVLEGSMRIPLLLSLVPAFGLMLGCSANEAFSGIQSVKIRHNGSRGLETATMTSRQHDQLVQCLYQTMPLEDDSTAELELLPSTYLVQVKDNKGDRLFELYTKSNLKGNRGKYYQNLCLHPLVKSLQKKKK